MALGGLAEGLLAAQDIIGRQQDQRYKQALLQLNQRQRQANAASWAALMSSGGDMSGGAMPSPGLPSPMPGGMTPPAPPPLGGQMPPDLSRLQNEILKLGAGGGGVPGGASSGGGPLGPQGPWAQPSNAQPFRSPTLLASADQATSQELAAGQRPPGYPPNAPAPSSSPAANVHADLDLPPAKAAAASNTAVDVAAAVPPQFAGRISLQQVAQMVERSAGRDVPDDVKFAAVANLYKLMAPAAQQQFQQTWEAYKFGAQQSQHREDIGERRADRAAGLAQTKELAEERMDIARQNAAISQQRAGQGERKTELAEQKQAQANQPPDESRVAFWANVMKKGMPMPAGLSRTAAGSKFVQAVMNKLADDGIASSQNAAGDYVANVATTKADTTSLTNLTKQADAATGFERTANTNLDNALRLAQNAVPTELGPWINKWIETGETQVGGPDVPPYTAAVLTAANEYAKIMNGSTGSQGSTVDSRREAAEMLSPYLSQGQIQGVAQVLKQDMANRRNSMYAQIEDVKRSLRTGQQRFPTAAQGEGGTKYTVGQVIDTPKGKMRVTGGDLNGDPDVEPVK